MSKIIDNKYYNKTNRWIIITVEIVNRELLGKLILSQHLINRGWKIVLASRQAIAKYLSILPRGVFYVKSATRIDEPYIEAASKYGFKIACLDEEGLVEHSLNVLVNNRLTDNNIKNIDYYFTWGKEQYLAFRERYSNYSKRIFLVGNPRVEIWKGFYNYIFKDQLQNIKKKYGDYIFIPTSFAPYNHYIGADERIDLFSRIYRLKNDRIKYEYAYSNYVKDQFNQALELIDKIAVEFSKIPIVIRIHPSEKKEKWESLSKKHSNVFIDKSHDLIPLIQQSKIILQSESTTAIQGFLLSKPVISFSKTPENIKKKYRLFLPNLCSKNFEKFDLLINFIKEIFQLKKNYKYENDKLINNELKDWIYNLDQDSSSINIIDVLEKDKSIKNTKKVNYTFSVLTNIILDLLTITRGFSKIWKLIPKNLKVFISLRIIANSGGIKQKFLTYIYSYKHGFFWKILPKGIKHLSEKRNADLGYGRQKKDGLNKDNIQKILDKISMNKNGFSSKVTKIDTYLFFLEKVDQN